MTGIHPNSGQEKWPRLQWDLYGDGEVTRDYPIWDPVREYNRKRKIVVGRFSKAYEGKSGEITTIGNVCRENRDQTYKIQVCLQSCPGSRILHSLETSSLEAWQLQ